MERFLSELKARNVVRVAGVYTVAAWGVFGVSKTVFETLGYPKVFQVWALLIATLGLPIAIGLSWAFERGPDGKIRRATAGEQGVARKLTLVDWGILGAIAAVLVVAVATAVGLAGSLSGEGIGGGAARKSVAVLPFDSFSTVPDTEYFADGLTEEVINSLAQVDDLKVAGRTSAFYFKGKNEDLRDIGRKLNVAHVVEGSVRRDGDRLRVTAQLIRASNGYHLWSETYDRTMDDSFAIQTEIAESVAEALKTELRVGRGGQGAKKDPEAYNIRLTANGKLREKGKANVLAAQALYERLIQLDPNDADAHADYAYTTAYLAQMHLEGDFLPAIREAEMEVAQALRLDPDNARAHMAKGMIASVRLIREGRQSAEAEAEAAFKRAVELAPKDPEALSLYGDFITSRRPEQAVSILERALDIDPLDRIAKNALAGALLITGRPDEAAAQYRANIDLFPEYIDSKEQLGDVLIEQGKFDEAVKWYRLAAEPKTDPAASLMLANLYYNLGLPREAEAALAPWKAHPIAGPLSRAVQLIVEGDFAGLLALCEAELAKPEPDPVWRDGITLAGTMLKRPDLAREQLFITYPELLEATPQVSRHLANEAVAGAHVIEMAGDRAQARRILGEVLAVTAPVAGRRQLNETRITRVKAYAMLGDKERALSELRGAIDQGYRRLYDLDVFMRLDDYPMIAPLRSDARFTAMIREIEADNARMRLALTAPPQVAARP